MSESVTYTAGIAITINANDVILDLNNHKITGPTPFAGTGILIENASRVITKNGLLANASACIHLLNVNDCIISDMHIYEVKDCAIAMDDVISTLTNIIR